MAVEQPQQAGQRAAVDDDLRLQIIPRHDVPNSAQRRGLDRRGRVAEQLDESADHAGLDHGLDLVIGAVGEVRERPAGVSEDLFIVRENQVCQARERR